MSRFKIKLKLQGLELEVEGSREDVPLITQAVGNQLAGMLTPATDIVEGEITSESVTKQAPEVTNKPSTKKSRGTKKSRSANSADTNPNGTKALAWNHDPEKWGMPQTSWNSVKKSIWLLYVVSQETQNTELSTGQLVATFNARFKQAGSIVSSNIARDLGKQRILPNTPLKEDTTKSPSTWSLTQAGLNRAKDLVQEALGQGSGGKN